MRKPHNDLAGYVCELKAKLGGHIVILDRENGASDIDADYRWIVMHMPSTQHIAVRSLAHARQIMKGVAKARSIDEACEHADILPRPATNGAEQDDDGASVTVKNQKRLSDSAERKAALNRFLADPENEPTEEGKAALRNAFGLGSAA
jgi:hypothetical protein